MEAPEIKVFSVSVVPPARERFADVSSIIVEPESRQSVNRRNACVLDGRAPNCSIYAASSELSVSVYFDSSRGAERDALLQEVRDYVDKKVLTCP